MVAILRLADIVAVGVCALIAFWLREDVTEMPPHYLLAVVLGMVGIVNAGQLSGLYQLHAIARVRGQFGRVSLLWLGVILILIALAYLTKTSDSFSRVWAITWFFMVDGALIINRVIAVGYVDKLRSDGKLARRIAIIGTGDKAARLRRLIENNDPREVTVAGVFAPEETGERGLEALTTRIVGDKIDEAVIAIDDNDHALLQKIITVLGTVSVETRIAPDTIDLRLPILGVSHIGTVPLFDIHHRPHSLWSRITKRIEDLVLGIVALVVLSPLMVLIAMAIKLTSHGPVLFRQQRLGFNNNAFTLFKFRSMYDHPDDSDTVPQARRDDARITPVGRLIRRASLDELPQLFNVLRGEMSLVGPRPHALAHNREYGKMINGYLARHRVKPGITGWAQVNGLRGETDTPGKMRLRVEHDLYYIDHWSLWLDLKILAQTLVVGFFHRNAY